MKKLLSLLLALTLVFALAACGNKDKPEDDSQDPGIVTPEGDTEGDPDGQPPEEEEDQTDGEDPVTPDQSTDGNQPANKPASKPTGGSQPSELPADKPTSDTSESKGDLATLMTQLLKGTESEMSVINEEISSDAFKSNLFIDYIDGAKAIASNAMMSSVAHSVCLLELPEGSDAEKIAKEIDANKDPRKWVCVEAESTAVLQSGNYILLAMSTTDVVNTVKDNFKAMF